MKNLKSHVECGVLAWVFLGMSSTGIAADVTTQPTFTTPQEAVQAVIKACRSNSTKQLLKVMGPDGKDIVVSGDPSDDRQARKDFIRLTAEKMEVVPDSASPDKATVTIGNGDWPFPVPLVRVDGKWHFDSAEGRAEIIARRVGANELSAIEICRGYVEAQKHYAETHHKNGLPEYAQKIVSTPGQQDGLYWPPTKGLPMCDVPPGFAQAAEEIAADKLEPYHGYFFRVLKGQGPDARGGAAGYIAKDSMIGGFALLARPSEYGVSGVKTFIVNNEGIVYERDLGTDTVKMSQGIATFNPDKSWNTVDQ